METDDEYAYCLTKEVWKNQCNVCKRNFNLYEYDKNEHYWIEHGFSKSKKCPKYESMRKAKS